MAKMTLEDLRKLRDTSKKEIDRRVMEGKEILIVIGMGTCGIAAGAKVTLASFLDALDKNGVHDVVVKQTGCMGLCYVEPTVEIKMPGMPDTIYGKVDAATAEQIVKKHIVEKSLVSDHIFDKPAPDIIKG